MKTTEYLREDKLPHIWCPGCGNGIVISNIIRAVDALNLKRENTVIVSGIGCSSRAAGYMNFDTLHTTHGRAIPFATGIKMANPDLNVIVISGDGDATAIGGNHFIHASRRNLDLTLIVVNNNIYGMTSGQYSPLTPTGKIATTAPYGNIDRPFDLCELAEAAGATYVARGSVYHVQQLKRYVERGIQNKGFSVIEALSICPTYFGRKNKMGSPVKMLEGIRDNAVIYNGKNKEEGKDKFLIGEFKNEPDREYTESYQKIIDSLKEGK